MKKIKLTKAEIQSGLNRVRWAEGLILQLPEKHEGRNSWLINYGITDEAHQLKGYIKNHNNQQVVEERVMGSEQEIRVLEEKVKKLDRLVYKLFSKIKSLENKITRGK